MAHDWADAEHLKSIELLTNKLLINVRKPPVDLDVIVNKVDVKIELFDFPSSISGVFKQKNKIIGVNKNNSLTRQRFTIAHELGHFMLGHDEEVDIIDDRFDHPISHEKEANVFASALLMPKILLEESVKQGLNITNLAKEYQVSEQAMTIRLLELNLIK